MVLKVIGAGPSRTGTVSLKHALEQLGFGECYHKGSVSSHPEAIDTFHAAYNGEKVDWKAVYDERYQAVVDFPATFFYTELLKAYPNAKVVLTVCASAEEWYERARDAIMAVSQSPMMKSELSTKNSRVEKLADILWDGVFEHHIEDKDRAIEVYQSHLDDVKRTVPNDQLLVFNIKDGWVPLCKFLGVDVPDVKFPHIDEKDAMIKMLNQFVSNERGQQ